MAERVRSLPVSVSARAFLGRCVLFLISNILWKGKVTLIIKNIISSPWRPNNDNTCL